MKILFLTPWYPDSESPNSGIFARDQAVALQKHHNVHVVSAKVDYTSFAFFSFSITSNTFKNVTEHHIRIKKSIPVFNQLLFLVVIIYQTARIGKRLTPDVIHGNIGYPGAFWSWGVSKILGKPYLVTEHTSRFVNNFRSLFHKWATIIFLRKAKTIISVSNHSADEVASFIGKRPMVIPNIIDFEKFNHISTTKAPICQIGFIGGLNTNTKGLDILLKALSCIKSEFVLHIGGVGSQLAEYKAYANELRLETKCIFHGFISHDQVPDFMKKIHFFVSASRFESFGMVMAEAMACGLPVVATNSGGPADFINRQNGILVEKENINELRNAIEIMISEYRNYNPIQIRDFAISKFAEDKFIQKMNDIYRSV